MRILYVADDMYPGFGGQARASEGHIAALRSRGHDLTVIAGREPHPSALPAGVRMVRMPSWQPGRTQTRFAHPIVSLISREVERADVVHANTPAALSAVALLLAGRRSVPVVMGVHTQLETSSLQLPLVGSSVTRLLSIWYRWLFSRADLLVAPTLFAAHGARAFSAGRVEVVSNGLDLASWPAPAAKERGGPRRLAYVGRLSAEKRPLDLLRIAEHLPDDFELVIAGSGPLEDRMEAEIGRLNLGRRVRLAGFISEAEKRKVLHDAELFIMPSPAELQSIATLEAMAAGCAVAVIDHPTSAVPTLVSEAQAGRLLPVDDAAAQARELMELLNSRAELAAAQRNARRYAEQHDVASSAARLEQLYQELVSGRVAVERGGSVA